VYCGVVKSDKGVPPGTSPFTPYEIIVLLGNTNKSPPGNDPYCPYTIVCYATVPVVFAQS